MLTRFSVAADCATICLPTGTDPVKLTLATRASSMMAGVTSAGRPMTAPPAPDLVRRYVELGLRLGRHNADIVDSYYGPAAWRDLIDAEPVTPAEGLVEEARRLILDLDADASAADHQLDTQRRHWLRSQTVGLHTVARMLHGDHLDFIDEVEEMVRFRHPEAASIALMNALRLVRGQ